MNGNPKPTEEVVLENNQFVGVGRGKVLTGRQAPPHHLLVRQDAVHHQIVEHPLITNGLHPLFGVIDLTRHLP